MRKKFCLILVIISCLFLTGCNDLSKNNFINTGEQSKYIIDKNLVNLSVKDGSLTNSKAILIIENLTGDDFLYGYPYLVECEKEDIWYEIVPINDLNFNLPAFSLKEKQSVETLVDWEYHYGKLPSGKYRIIKTVFSDKDTSTKEINIAVEFTIK